MTAGAYASLSHHPSRHGDGLSLPLLLTGIGCALLPMTGMAGPSFMGELARTASVWFFLPGTLLSLHWPVRRSGAAVMIFGAAILGWILTSGALNAADILAAEFRGRSGLEKFLTSSAVVVYGLLISYTIARVPEPLIYKGVIVPILLGVFLAAIVGLIEVLWWTIPSTAPLYQTVVNFVRPGYPHLAFWGRLTSVGFEPHALGLWLGFAFPITLWGARTSRGVADKALWIAGLASTIGMLLLSEARSGLLVAALVAAVWLSVELWRCLQPQVAYPARLLVAAMAILLLAVLTGQLVGREATGENLIGGQISNLSRYAMNVSAFEMVPEAPVAGRGLGQYAFWSEKYIPSWGWSSYEVRAWLVEQRRGWPSTFSLPGRLLSELGVIGFLSWYGGIAAVVLSALSRVRTVLPATRDGSGGVLVLLLCPYLLFCGLANDTFAQGGFWVALGLTAQALNHARTNLAATRHPLAGFRRTVIRMSDVQQPVASAHRQPR